MDGKKPSGLTMAGYQKNHWMEDIQAQEKKENNFRFESFRRTNHWPALNFHLWVSTVPLYKHHFLWETLSFLAPLCSWHYAQHRAVFVPAKVSFQRKPKWAKKNRLGSVYRGYYPVVWGLFHKPWHKDSFMNQPWMTHGNFMNQPGFVEH